MSMGSDSTRGIPPGIFLIPPIRGNLSSSIYTYVVLPVTFIAYTCYHASQKPSSIIKSVLDPDPRNQTITNQYPWPLEKIFVKEEFGVSYVDRPKNRGWAPFDGINGTSKLREIDAAFLVCYSMGMYVAGHLGDSLDLR